MHFVLVSAAIKYTAQTIKYSSHSWTSSRHTVRCTKYRLLFHFHITPHRQVLTFLRVMVYKV